MINEKLFLENGATPLTVADCITRECNDKDFLLDVIFYLEAFIKRTYTSEVMENEKIIEKWRLNNDKRRNARNFKK